MIWWVLVLECIVMAVLFTGMIAIMESISPISFVSDYPPEIQEEYYKRNHLEKTKEKLTILMILKKVIFMVVAIFACGGFAYLAGARTFLYGALCGLLYAVAIGCFDTFFLDWVVFPRVKKWRLPGTEDMDKEYHQKWFHVKVVLPVLPLAFVFAALVGLTVMLYSL